MEQLELKTYTREEIAAITGRKINSRQFARDVKHDLAAFGYKYEWINRVGVQITSLPEGNEARFKNLLVERLGIDSQVNPIDFACFISALSTYKGFDSMPYRKREEVMNEICGHDISESTLRNWARKLFASKNAERFRKGALWKTYRDEHKIKRQVKVEIDSDEYKHFCEVRSDTLETLDKMGVPANQRWGMMICELYKEYGHFYYCPEICLNALGDDVEEICELVTAIMEERQKVNQRGKTA